MSALFELLGSGVGDSVLVDDGQRVRSFHDVPLPFRKEIPISTDADLLQVITSGSHATGSGCRITVEGKVVVEHLDSSGCSVNLKSQN